MAEKLKNRSGPKGKRRVPSNKTGVLRKLSAMETAFVGFYVACNNGTQAAIKAGYSERSAAPQSTRLLRKDNIQQKIEETREKALKSESLTPEKIVKELKIIAFTNPIDFYENWFQEKDMESVRHLGPAISEISTKIDPTTGEKLFKLKFHDKLKALEMLKEFMPRQEENIEININFTGDGE